MVLMELEQVCRLWEVTSMTDTVRVVVVFVLSIIAGGEVKFIGAIFTFLWGCVTELIIIYC